MLPTSPTPLPSTKIRPASTRSKGRPPSVETDPIAVGGQQQVVVVDPQSPGQAGVFDEMPELAVDGDQKRGWVNLSSFNSSWEAWPETWMSATSWYTTSAPRR